MDALGLAAAIGMILLVPTAIGAYFHDYLTAMTVAGVTFVIGVMLLSGIYHNFMTGSRGPGNVGAALLMFPFAALFGAFGQWIKRFVKRRRD